MSMELEIVENNFVESKEDSETVEAGPRELIKGLLADLFLLRTTRDDIAEEKEERLQALIAKVLNPEQMAAIKQIDADVEAEFVPRFERIESGINAMTNKITSKVKELQESVKGIALHAVYSGGRVSWDDKALQGFAITHPKIKQFRKVGEPSVAIRTVKDSDA